MNGVVISSWFFFLFLAVLPFSLLNAQSLVPTNVQIHVAGQEPLGYAPCEPSIAINPTNPDHMVAGAVLDYVYVSEDAGATWSRDRMNAKAGVFGDPCLVAGPQGDFYYAHLSNPDGEGWETEALLDRIVVQHSKPKKKGKKWNKGAGVGQNGAKDQDKEWLAVSPSGDKLAVCWTEFDHYGSEAAGDSTRIMCSTSDRKATTWSDPVKVSAMEGNCLDGDSTVEGAVPVWMDEMTLGVAWAHGEHIRWNVSSDAGETFRPYEQYIADII
ncbi:exo-alpha-sialidase, partial [Flavobacteriales bacterium]|nr:exo-alpha-sialidase [Flavobacteriales bacterium]